LCDASHSTAAGSARHRCRAADLFNDRAVPFFDSHGIPLARALTDGDAGYYGNPEHHEYALSLAVENIDHTGTKARAPQTNAIVK
jgi:hypothetical protein